MEVSKVSAGFYRQRRKLIIGLGLAAQLIISFVLAALILTASAAFYYFTLAHNGGDSWAVVGSPTVFVSMLGGLSGVLDWTSVRTRPSRQESLRPSR